MQNDPTTPVIIYDKATLAETQTLVRIAEINIQDGTEMGTLYLLPGAAIEVSHPHDNPAPGKYVVLHSSTLMDEDNDNCLIAAIDFTFLNLVAAHSGVFAFHGTMSRMRYSTTGEADVDSATRKPHYIPVEVDKQELVTVSVTYYSAEPGKATMDEVRELMRGQGQSAPGDTPTSIPHFD